MAKSNKNKDYLPIGDYGIIGNLHTIALVSTNASIDYMCFPRFDSPSVFCRLLDADTGGFYSITPHMKEMVTKQLYLPDTNVLVTRFFSDEGIAEIIDYMPVEKEERKCSLIRQVSTIRGKIRYRLCCSPHFGYAHTDHWVEKVDDSFIFHPDSNDQPSLLLSSSSSCLSQKSNRVEASFELHESQSTCFVLQWHEKHAHSGEWIKNYVIESYRSTIQFWQSWIAQSSYKGHWQEVVRRSALTLKLLISQQFGSMVAAPTFSLPETIGQGRNWDYRYTWIRDAAFAMHTFLQLGFLEEADNFLHWVKEQSTTKELQLMFSIDGRTDLTERCLDYMDGYKSSKPVRIGNKAHQQTQMDIYGELLETIYIFVKHGGDITYEYWKIIAQYIEFVISNWHEPDHSIWEVRGQKREFFFSRMMCWVAVDRAVKIADLFSFPYDMLRWHEARNAIYEDVHENFWNKEKGAFVQFKGSDRLDASVLLMPILNMISPQSEKWKKTMKAIDKELRSDVLVYRYREQEEEIDGLKGSEGTFSMCSFWYVECLALCGQVERAKENFEKMLGYANHLGLYAEQLGMKGEQLGNFPQAFTHLALISAAIELNKARKTNTVSPLHNMNKEMK